jgi:hypothetical protein
VASTDLNLNQKSGEKQSQQLSTDLVSVGFSPQETKKKQRKQGN